MRVVRDHIGLGSWFALIALVLNLALSFGHFHAIGGHRHGAVIVVVVSSDAAQTGHEDGLADDHCPVCIAATLMGNALAAAAPALPHPIADTLVDRVVEPVVAFVEPPKAAFRSRAPPIS